MEKRNRLLSRLLHRQKIDSLTFELALEEQLPAAPQALPQLAPHLLDRAQQELKIKGFHKQARVNSTLDASLQQKSSEHTYQGTYASKVSPLESLWS